MRKNRLLTCDAACLCSSHSMMRIAAIDNTPTAQARDNMLRVVMVKFHPSDDTAMIPSAADVDRYCHAVPCNSGVPCANLRWANVPADIPITATAMEHRANPVTPSPAPPRSTTTANTPANPRTTPRPWRRLSDSPRSALPRTVVITGCNAAMSALIPDGSP